MSSLFILEQTRRLTHKVVAGLTTAQFREIPPGFDNNILWNLGHIIVVEQLLHYRLSGLPMHVPDSMVAMFRAGTSPADWQEQPDAEELIRLNGDLAGQLAADYRAERLLAFEPYTTSTGIYLRNIEDALAFNNYHEGLHLGAIMALRNLVR